MMTKATCFSIALVTKLSNAVRMSAACREPPQGVGLFVAGKERRTKNRRDNLRGEAACRLLPLLLPKQLDADKSQRLRSASH
jgi:hypothetical protein